MDFVKCSDANKVESCKGCKHSKQHRPINSIFSYDLQKRKMVATGKCTQEGRCSFGLHMKWNCKCLPVKKKGLKYGRISTSKA